jgi:hypothetical protein
MASSMPILYSTYNPSLCHDDDDDNDDDDNNNDGNDMTTKMKNDNDNDSIPTTSPVKTIAVG